MLKLFLKKWILFFIIMISNLIIGAKTSIAFFHFFFWFLLSLAALSLIWIALQYFTTALYLTRKAPSKVEAEDTLQIEALLKNDSFMPALNIAIEDYLSCAGPREKKKLLLVEYLGARSFINLKYKCFCPLRGRYEIGPIAIYLFDPLGLFFLKRIYRIYSEIYVYPRTFVINKFPNLVKGNLPWFGIETARVSGDEDEFYGVREYKEGDPIKRIHWISTARKNSLVVKQFQRQSFFRASIVFNLESAMNFGEGNQKVAECIIKIAASVTKYLIEKGIDISLQVIVQADEIVHIPFNKGPGHLEDIVKFLAVVKAESRVSLGEVFEKFSSYIPNDSTLIVIMLDKDWVNLSKILQLEKRNISLVPLILASSTFLYSLDNQDLTKEIRIKLSEIYNFRPILISCQDNLEEVFLKI